MSNITDRELLAFCSLAKLKLEFSQYKAVDDDKNTTTYKTIRQLIDLEIEGQHNRKGVKYEDKLRGELEEELEAAKKNLIKTKEEKAKYEEHMKSIDILEKERIELYNKKPKFESDVFSKRFSEAERLKNNYMAALDYNRSEVWPNLEKIRNYLSYLGKIKSSDGVLPMDYEHELEFLKLQKADVESLIKDEISRNDRPVDKNYISQKTSELEKIKSEMNPLELEKQKIDVLQKEIDNKISENVPKITEDDISKAEENIKQREAALLEHEKVIETHTNNGKNMGMFYRKIDDEPIEYLYKDVDALRTTSPLLMAYYDIRPKNNRNSFLDEWEIVFAGDCYEIGKLVYEENKLAKEFFYKGLLNELDIDKRDIVEEEKKKLCTFLNDELSHMANRRFVTRKEARIRDNWNIKIEYGLKLMIVASYALSNTNIKPDLLLNKLNDKWRKTLKDIQSNFLLKSLDNRLGAILKDITYFDYLDWHYSSTGYGLGVSNANILTILLNNLTIFLDTSTYTKAAKIDLDEDDVKDLLLSDAVKAVLNDSKFHKPMTVIDNGLRVVLVKNKKSSECCFITECENNVTIYNKLDSGFLPDESSYLRELIKILIKKHKNNNGIKLLFTGMETGGKLAIVLSSMTSDSEKGFIYPSRGFFKNEPSGVTAAFAYTEISISSIYQNNYLFDSLHKLERFGDSLGLPLLGLSLTVILGLLGMKVLIVSVVINFSAAVISTLYPIISDKKQESSLSVLIKEFLNKNIIENTHTVNSKCYSETYSIEDLIERI